MNHVIDIDEYLCRGSSGALELSTAFIEAGRRALNGGVTYILSDGEPFAAVNPPEAAERYEHAAMMEIQPRFAAPRPAASAPARPGKFGRVCRYVLWSF